MKLSFWLLLQNHLKSVEWILIKIKYVLCNIHKILFREQLIPQQLKKKNSVILQKSWNCWEKHAITFKMLQK